jgi:hypothetical protein
VALKMCSRLKLFNASNAKIMNFCLSIIARGYRGRNVVKFERRCCSLRTVAPFSSPGLPHASCAANQTRAPSRSATTTPRSSCFHLH